MITNYECTLKYYQKVKLNIHMCNTKIDKIVYNNKYNIKTFFQQSSHASHEYKANNINKINMSN